MVHQSVRTQGWQRGWREVWLGLPVSLLLFGALVACNRAQAPSTVSAEEANVASATRQSSDTVVAPAADAEMTAQGDEIPRPNPDTGLTPPFPEDEACEQAVTQSDLNICAQKSYAETDAQLTEALEALLADLPDSSQQALQASQQRWIDFRDLDCDWARARYEGGSIAPLIYGDCLTQRNERRLTELTDPPLPTVSYAAADVALNEAYQALGDVLSAERRQTLTTAQLAWIDYRDRHCEFEVLHSDVVMESSQCLARVSEVRTEQLGDMLLGQGG